MDLSSQISTNQDPLQEVGQQKPVSTPVVSTDSATPKVTDITPAEDISIPVKQTPVAAMTQSEVPKSPPLVPTATSPDTTQDPKSNPLYEDPDLVVLTK